MKEEEEEEEGAEDGDDDDDEVQEDDEGARRAEEEASESIGLRSQVEALVAAKGWTNVQLVKAIGDNYCAATAWRKGKASDVVMQRVTPKMQQLLARLQAKTSKYRGVTLCTWFKYRGGKWKAVIHHTGKSHYLGSFEDEEEAARAYDRAARAHCGEKAELNFPAKGDEEGSFATNEHDKRPVKRRRGDSPKVSGSVKKKRGLKEPNAGCFRVKSADKHSVDAHKAPVKSRARNSRKIKNAAAAGEQTCTKKLRKRKTLTPDLWDGIELGTKIKKLFPGYGTHTGVVDTLLPNGLVHVAYADGDSEDLHPHEVKQMGGGLDVITGVDHGEDTFLRISGDAKDPSTPTASASAENANHKCSICLDPPVQPISLPCTHTFCQECLQKYRAHTTAEKIVTRRGVRVSCPNCRAVTTMENANGMVSNSPPTRAQLTRSERCKGGVCSSTTRCAHKTQRVEEEGGGEEEEQEEEQQQEEQEEDKRGDGAVFRPGVRVCALWEGEWLKAYYRRLEEEGLHAVSEVVHGCSTWSVLDVELEMGWGSVPS
jgi:hypothetical protein